MLPSANATLRCILQIGPLAKSSLPAGIPHQATIRDIEQGKDVKLSNRRAVVPALGLELELVHTAA